MQTVMISKQKLFLIPLLASLFCCSEVARAQTKTFVVHETRPLIMHGPYLVAPTETGVTVVWTTDTPSHSKVLYGTGGKLTEMVEPAEHGLKPVGTLHTVRLTGLTPGQTYQYRVVSTRVVELKPNWPEKGLSVKSPTYTFTTLDSRDSTVTFSYITDTQHEDVPRLNANLDLVDWEEIAFLVHGGDALSWVEDRAQLFAHFLDPVTKRLDHRKPLVFVRGNHEARGPYARHFYEYVPTGTGQFYYTFNAGPVHFIVLDTGEDKPDTHNEYSNLNQFAPYREQEFAWLKRHVRKSERVTEAPFTVLLMHQPRWGWVDGEKEKWTQLANEAGVDLVISGHYHRSARIPPGKYGNDYPILVVDQDQVAEVTASETKLQVVVTGKDGTTVDSFSLPAEGALPAAVPATESN